VEDVEKSGINRSLYKKIAVVKSWLQTLDKWFIKTEFLHKNKSFAKSLCVKTSILPLDLHRLTTACKHIVHKANIAEDTP